MSLRRAVALSILFLPMAAQADPSDEEVFALSLEDLLRLPVQSVSHREESLRETPARVIVITREQLRQRGYRDFTELLDDLPGMDVSHVWGDKYLSVVWRGFRQTLGTPFLLLLDGQRLNQLYYADAELMATLPLSNIERIEIVYGPGSVAYGADAFVGLINVVTADDCTRHASGFVALGDNRQRTLDASACWEKGPWRAQLSTRVDDRRVDDRFLDRYVWSDPDTLARRDLWGDFLDDPRYGRFRSPIANRGLDLRLSRGDQALTYQAYRLDTGYGLEYPADAAQPNAHWIEDDQVLAWRRQQSLGANWKSDLQLRWHRSAINPRSDFLEGYNYGGVRLLDYSHWGVQGRSLEAAYRLQWQPADDAYTVSSGVEWTDLRIQKAASTEFGPSLPVDQIDLDTYPFPPNATDEPFADNRARTRQWSSYLIGRYRWAGGEGRWQHDIHGGYRHDDNSQFGAHDTWRFGYVGERGAWTVKALYGESFEVPPPRLLYGGWQGAGSDPNLAPHTSRTHELVIGQQAGEHQLELSLYRIASHGIFRTGAGGARNAGDTRVRGAELSWRGRYALALGSLDISTALTWQRARETDDGPATDGGGLPVDSVAPRKAQFQASLERGRQSWGLRARAYAARPTQPSNPVGRVPGYALFDLDWSRSLDAHWSIQAHVTNVFDRAVRLPGVYTGDAGLTPGRYVDGRWQGSAGFFNSLLPQPGRLWELRLLLDW